MKTRLVSMQTLQSAGHPDLKSPVLDVARRDITSLNARRREERRNLENRTSLLEARSSSVVRSTMS